MDKHVELWVNKKINDMSFEEREGAVHNVIREQGTLYERYVGCSDRIIKALFLMNSGGVVTVLAYLHSNNSSHIDQTRFSWLPISLDIFLLGLICAFILVAYDYLTANRIYFCYLKQRGDFLDNKIIFSNIDWFSRGKVDSYWEKLKKYASKICYFIFVYFAGALSFSCAIIGIALGVYGYQLI